MNCSIEYTTPLVNGSDERTALVNCSTEITIALVDCQNASIAPLNNWHHAMTALTDATMPPLMTFHHATNAPQVSVACLLCTIGYHHATPNH